MVEYAVISKLPNFNLFSGFYTKPFRIIFLNIYNDPFLYFIIHVALLVGSPYPLFSMLVELMPR